MDVISGLYRVPDVPSEERNCRQHHDIEIELKSHGYEKLAKC